MGAGVRGAAPARAAPSLSSIVPSLSPSLTLPVDAGDRAGADADARAGRGPRAAVKEGWGVWAAARAQSPAAATVAPPRERARRPMRAPRAAARRRCGAASAARGRGAARAMPPPTHRHRTHRAWRRARRA